MLTLFVDLIVLCTSARKPPNLSSQRKHTFVGTWLTFKVPKARVEGAQVRQTANKTQYQQEGEKLQFKMVRQMVLILVFLFLLEIETLKGTREKYGCKRLMKRNKAVVLLHLCSLIRKLLHKCGLPGINASTM